METNPELERSMLQRYFTLSCSLLCSCSGAGHGGNSFEEHHAAGADRDHPQLPQGEYDQRAGQARGLAPWGGQRGQRVLWWPGPPPFCIHSCGGRHSWTSPLLWGGSAGWSWLWVRLLPVPVGNWWNTGRISSHPPTHTRLNSLWEPWNPPKDPSESGHLCRSEAKVANKNNFPHDLEICSVTFCIWERTQNFIRRIFSLGQFAECSALFPPCGTLLISFLKRFVSKWRVLDLLLPNNGFIFVCKKCSWNLRKQSQPQAMPETNISYNIHISSLVLLLALSCTFQYDNLLVFKVLWQFQVLCIFVKTCESWWSNRQLNCRERQWNKLR